MRMRMPSFKDVCKCDGIRHDHVQRIISRATTADQIARDTIMHIHVLTVISTQGVQMRHDKRVK